MARKYDRDRKPPKAGRSGAQATEIELRLGLSQGMISRSIRQLHSRLVMSKSAIYIAIMRGYLVSAIAVACRGAGAGVARPR